MTLNFRGAEIDFKLKNLYIRPEKETRNSTVNDLMFGADTESAECDDENGTRYEPICTQLAGANIAPALRYLRPRANALQEFLEFFDDYAGLKIMQRQTKHHRCFCYFHNMQYDWGQLIKNYPALIFMMKTGTSPNEDFEIFDNGEFKAILKPNALFRGNAPFFTIEIFHNKDVNYEIRFRDTSSYFQAPLAKLGKELNLELFKREHPENLGKIDFRKLPDTDPAKIEFELYAKADPEVTRLVAENIRQLHIQNKMHKIRVSAPSFAMGILTGNEKEYKLKNGCRDESIMQLIIDSYAGGRTGGLYHGNVKNVSVLDIHSSYPTSMCTIPSFGEQMVYYEMPAAEIAALSTDDLIDVLNTYHAFMEIDGIETDNKYPCLLYASNQLYPVYGEFHNLKVSGVEVFVGLKTNSLTITKIHRLILLLDSDNPYLPFKEFAESAYTRKAVSGKGTPEYTAAKLVLNSSYGKLIEKISQLFIATDHNMIVPYIKDNEKDFAEMYYNKYCEMIEAGEMDFLNYADDMITELMTDEDLKDKFDYTLLSNLGLSKLSFGQYAIPAAAALITATSRARLLAGMKLLQPIYWDTDSLFFIGELNIDEVNEKLKESANILPAFIQPLKIGEALGDLDIEIKNANGYLAGTKRYYLESSEEIKSARHGMPSTSKKDCKDLIRNLANGENAEYQGKPKPLQIKEAGEPEKIGQFISKKYVSNFKLDDRLNWTKQNNGWIGTVKEFKEIGA